MTQRDYALCGWRVRSMLPLPELAPWNGPADAVVDVSIVAGKLTPVAVCDPWLTVEANGSVRLSVHDLVRFLVEGGRQITVDILRQEQAPAWRLFLLGAVIGILCHQRGVFPLHAASLTIGGRTVALLGASGAGKSTLALALVRRGHSLLSDDLTVLGLNDLIVLPSFARLKLWRDTLEAMGEDLTGLERVRDALDKFDLRPTQHFDPAPCRLDSVLLLGTGEVPELVPLRATAAVPLIASHVSRPYIGRLLGRQPALFAAAARVASAVPVARLLRPLDYDRLEDAARLVEASVAA